jgi:hypothetical protein
MDNFYESLGEATEPYSGMSVKILKTAESYDNYIRSNGKWVFNSKVTIDMY